MKNEAIYGLTPFLSFTAATLEPPSTIFVFLALRLARDVGTSQTISLFVLAQRVPSPA
jgi:hypothetical protein